MGAYKIQLTLELKLRYHQQQRIYGNLHGKFSSPIRHISNFLSEENSHVLHTIAYPKGTKWCPLRSGSVIGPSVFVIEKGRQ